MSIKIDSPKRWRSDVGGGRNEYRRKRVFPDDKPCRIIAEGDWKKLMAVVRAADGLSGNDVDGPIGVSFRNGPLDENSQAWVAAVIIRTHALRKHLKKKK